MKVRSRFSGFRDKFQVFLLGLLFGLVLGGGFFVLKLDQYVKELGFYKSLTQSDDQAQNSISDLNTQPETKPKPKKTKRPETVVTPVDTNAATNSDSASGILDNDGNGDGIVVRKDEMLGQKVFTTHMVDEDQNDTLKKDAATGSAIVVEFWKSPLNYRGYKFSRNKLVLFGLESADVEGIYNANNTFYLKSANGIYRLDLTNDFHQFEKVSDDDLISSLK